MSKKLKKGTTIKIIRTCDGCRGAEGKIGVVTNESNNEGLLGFREGYNVKTENGRVWRINKDAEVEVLAGEKIIIYREDDKVIALDKATGKKGVAKCDPRDKFDFETGAKLAFERLLTPPILNTRILVLTNGSLSLTKGKIYDITNGQFTSDNGHRLPYCKTLKDIDDLTEYFSPDGGFSSVKIDFVEVKPGDDIEALKAKYLGYSGRVLCTDPRSSIYFTKGKIYDIKESVLIDDEKTRYEGNITSFSDLDILLPKFVELKKQDEYEVGDIVKVKSWEQMEKEFGVDSDGDIRTSPCFVTDMRKYAGQIMRITDKETRYYGRSYELNLVSNWSFSRNMIEGKLVGDVPDDLLYKEDTEIKVGDKVRVIDNGCSYTTYTAWVKKNVKDEVDRYKYDYGNVPKNGSEGVVRCIAKHDSYVDFCAYVEIEGRCYIINVKALEKVNR